MTQLLHIRAYFERISMKIDKRIPVIMNNSIEPDNNK